MLPAVEEDQARDHINCLNTRKLIGSGEMPPRLLSVLIDVTVRPLSNIFESSWHLGEVPDDWKKREMSELSSGTTKKRIQGTAYSLLCLHSVSRKIMEPVLLETLSRCMKNKKVMGSSQHVLGRAHCAWPSFSDQDGLLCG